jgi:hypothetical protein
VPLEKVGDQLGPSVRNEVLHRVKEERNILHRNANWIGHIKCRNCLLKFVIQGKIEGWLEVRGRRERRGKQLLDDFKDEALDRTLWRTRCGRGYGPVVRQTTE